jgi:hypothetical protein
LAGSDERLVSNAHKKAAAFIRVHLKGTK